MTLPPYPKFHDGFNGLNKSCFAIITKAGQSVNKFFVNFSIFRAVCCVFFGGSPAFSRAHADRQAADRRIVDKMQ